MPYTWLIYDLLSAIFVAMVAIFGKIGLKILTQIQLQRSGRSS